MAKRKESAADKALIISRYGVGIGGSVISGLWGTSSKAERLPRLRKVSLMKLTVSELWEAFIAGDTIKVDFSSPLLTDKDRQKVLEALAIIEKLEIVNITHKETNVDERTNTQREDQRKRSGYARVP